MSSDVALKPERLKSGVLGTLMNLIKPFIGAGILSLPRSWARAGWVLSTITLFILTYVASYCILALANCSDIVTSEELRYTARKRIYRSRNNCDEATAVENVDFFTESNDVTEDDIVAEDWNSIQPPTMSDVGCMAFGKPGRLVTDIFIVISQMGAGITYLSFISATIPDVINRKDSFNNIHMLLVMFIPTVLLCLIRNISRLAITSLLGNVIYFFLIGCAMYLGSKLEHQPIKNLTAANWEYYPTVFSTVSFALEGIAIVLPIKYAMKEPKKFKMALSGAMVSIAIIYLAFALGCYFLFGNLVDTPDGFISILDSTSVLKTIIQIA
uniref:Proton-coupled amino acid transporter 1 n=1 Tax=Lygus hesperus TaxID=30085 RepID=A0A0A9Y754_LYGHE